jgi:hypothetical protein
MFKLSSNSKGFPKIIPMSEMGLLDIGVIIEGPYQGEWVMRTADLSHFEVIRLQSENPDCWVSKTGAERTKVQLCPPGTEISFTVI